ncbi:hybrid signal transduction histidine kinase M [Tanacetum coccineum]
MRYTTSTLLYQKNWISLNPTTPRGVTSSKAIVVTLVSSNTSKAQAHSRPHPHLPRTIGFTTYSILKRGIFLHIFQLLRKRLIKANPKTAKDAWDTIEAIFQDNKRTRVVALKGELRMIQMGDQQPRDQDDVVTYAINGLSDKYGSLAQIIAHKEPFPDLSTVRSMVSTKEMRIRNKSPSLSTRSVKTLAEVFCVGVPPAWYISCFRLGPADGSLNRYKARLVANGSTQIVGIDVDETFSPVVKPATILMAFNVLNDHPLWVKKAGGVAVTLWAWFQRLQPYAARDALPSAPSLPSLRWIFSMTDLGLLNYFLGGFRTRNTLSRCFFLSQQMVCHRGLQGFYGIGPLHDPGDILMPFNRFVLFILHVLEQPHILALKRILRYVRGIITAGLQLIFIYRHTSFSCIFSMRIVFRLDCPTYTALYFWPIVVFLGQQLLCILVFLNDSLLCLDLVRRPEYRWGVLPMSG